MSTRRDDFDDVRSLVNEEDDNFPIDALGLEIEDPDAETGDPPKTRFLGMTAGERAFLSVVLFFNVLILGVGLLFVTGRIVIGG